VNEARAELEEPGELVPFDPVEQLDVGRQALTQVIPHRPHPDHREPMGEIPKGLDHQLGPLVWDQAVDPEEPPGLLLGGGPKVVDVDRGVDDNRVTIVEAPDSLAHRTRDRDVGVGASRRLEVGSPKAA
jgi:hypothetical protein